MLEIRRILYPTDFSETAQYALPEARRLAKAHGARLHMLHVMSPFTDAGVPTPDPGEAGTAVELEDAASGHTRVRRHVSRSPDVAATILEHARDLDIDLIVMGSHGRRGARRWILGSVADEVVREAECPVLLVRSGTNTDEALGYRRILAPVDFSSATPTVVRHAEALARASGAALDLLHVIELPAYPDFYISALAAPESRRRAVERLTLLAGEVEPEIVVETAIETGRVADEICGYAEAHGHDLIVIGSHRAGGLKRLALGSAAEAVARCSPCPVLVLKIGGRDLAESVSRATAATAAD